MTLKTYVGNILASYLGDITRFWMKMPFSCLFLLFFLLTPCMATNLKISGLDLVLCTKIAWKIQIWRCICFIRCLSCSNLTFRSILWLFFSYFKYIWQLFAMNPKLAKTFDTIFLTNFLCSFTWWGSYVGLMKTSLTFRIICDEK